MPTIVAVALVLVLSSEAAYQRTCGWVGIARSYQLAAILVGIGAGIYFAVGWAVVVG